MYLEEEVTTVSESEAPVTETEINYSSELETIIEQNTLVIEHLEKIENGVMCVLFFIVLAAVTHFLARQILSWFNGA